jgi:hypothetical protein
MALVRRPAAVAARVLALSALAAALVAPMASAALYKWVDANGRVVYSDQPPIGNVKSEIVGAAAPAANPDAVKELANKEAEFRKRQLDKQDEAKKSDKARAEAQKLASVCAQARAQASGLRRADVAMYRLNDKGERVLMDEAARRAEAERLDALVKERNCP